MVSKSFAEMDSPEYNVSDELMPYLRFCENQNSLGFWPIMSGCGMLWIPVLLLI